MSTFSVNQVRHLFVAKAYKATPVTSADAVGTISVESNTDGDLYFLYRGVDGVMRSDLIKIANILSGKATAASSLARGLQKKIVALDSTVNSGAPVAGQDYLLKIALFEHIGLSFEDQYQKYGVVHAIASMTAEQFYLKMIESLNLNFSREVVPMFTFTLTGAQATKAMATNTGITITAVNPGTVGNAITFAVSSVTATTAAVTVTGNAISVALTAAANTIGDLKALVAADATAAALVTIAGTNATEVSVEDTAVTLAGGTGTGIIVEEVAQPWVLGKMESNSIKFNIQPDLITVSGDEVIWGTVTSTNSTTFVGDGQKIADMEYFYMGERGDIYRGIGFPNDIKTTYLVDSTLEYNVFDMHFFYSGDNEAVQKSEKDITLVFPHEGVNLAAKVALANSVIGAINTAASTSFATLATS